MYLSYVCVYMCVEVEQQLFKVVLLLYHMDINNLSIQMNEGLEQWVRS